MDKLYNQNRAFPITIPKSWSHVADVICSSLSNSTTTTTSKTTTAKTNDSVLPDSQINTPRSPTPPPIRVLICGATHVGKSTCLRYMVNRILNHQITQHSQHFKNSNKNNSNHGSTPQHQYDGVTMVLDCDVGQPEFSPPGMLSLTQVHEPLLSPPHMHMASGNSNGYGYTDTTKNEDSNDTTKPFFFNKSPMHLDSYFFGDTSSKSDPITYTNIISKLMNSYEQIIQSIKITTTTTHDEWSDEPIRSDQEEREEMYRSDNDTSSSQIPPLLVNTDGWVKGMGGEILSAIIDIVRPTHIIQIMGHSKAKCFELPRFTTIMNECEIFVIKTFARGQNQQIRIQPNFSETDHNNNNDSCNIDGDGDGNGSENSVKSDSNSQSSSPTKKLTKQRRLNYNINNECMPKIANNAAHAKSTDLRALRIYTYFMSGGVGGGANNDLLSLYDTATFAPPEVQFTHSGFIDPNGSIASTMGRLKPYAVSFDSVRYYIQAEEADIGDYLDVYEEESLILDGLNATIVGLCCCMNHYECGLDNDHDRNDSLVPNHQQLKEFHQHHNYIPRCLGLGIIRSIDRNRRLFYVLTPISLHTLQSVNLLIGGGKIPLPSEFLSKVGAGVCSSVPYQCYDDLMAGLLGSNAIKSRGHGEMA